MASRKERIIEAIVNDKPYSGKGVTKMEKALAKLSEAEAGNGNGGSGGGGVSSWNDLTDKPFGEKILGEKQLCIAPQTHNFVQATDMNGNPFPWTSKYLTGIGGLSNAEVGDVAVVVIDGVEYEFEAQVKGESAPYFGNMSISDDTFDEPLYPDAKILILLGGGGGTCIFYLDESLIGEHEVAVYLCKTEETKLSYNSLADLPVYENVTRLVACEDVAIEIVTNEVATGPNTYATQHSCYVSLIGELGIATDSGMDTLVDWKIKDGDKCVVVLDGKEHEYEFRHILTDNGDEYSGFSVGNSDLCANKWYTDLATGDELYIRAYSGSITIYTTSDLVGTHTISIYAEQSELKQLDSKFLPEHLQFGEEATFYDHYLTETEVVTSHSISFDDSFMALADESVRPIINIDGVEYELVIGMDGDTGDYTGTPVGIDGYSIYITSSKIEGYVNVPEGETHTIAIYDKRVDYQRLDEKFMPTLTSPNGTIYKLTVSDDGTIAAVVVE